MTATSPTTTPTETPTENPTGQQRTRRPRLIHRRSHYDVTGEWVALCGWRARHVRTSGIRADSVPCPACEAAENLWFGGEGA